MIVGRDAERATVRSVLEAARRGDGGALVLTGEPGAGKSVLLADAVAAAQPMRVLRVRGVESESPLAFAALHRLLRPLMSGVDTLPARQAATLRAALGQADDTDGGRVDRFLVYLAVLTLLSEAAAATPTLVAIDDGHWLDDASREALLFVARRTEGEHLAVLLAVRDDAPVDPDLRTLSIGSLGPAATRLLLTDAAGAEVPQGVAEGLHARTGGNPLALAELAGALHRDVLLGRSPLPAVLPLTGGVESAFLDRYHGLDAAAQVVVLLAAADDAGDLATVEEAARELGSGDAALDAAERSGLLTRHGGQVELRHPLVRSAVYGGATTPQRRRVHAALAQALRGTAAADRRAWHLAAATDHPDEKVVGELEASARRSAAVGGHEAAAAAWERAAELTADPARRARRLHKAAAEAWTAGRPDRAATLADAALLSTDDPVLRADAALLRARIEWNTGSALIAHRRLLQEAAAVAPHDPGRAREMAMFAASLAAAVPLEASTDLLPLAGEPTTARDRCVEQVLRSFVHIARHEWADAVVAVRSAESHADDADPGLDGLLANLALAAMHVGLDDVALRLHERLLVNAREAGALILVLYALTRRGGVDTVLGRWDQLAAGAQESLRLAEATGRPGLAAMPRAWLTLVSAMRGDGDASAHLAALERTGATGLMGTTSASVKDQLLWVRALLTDSPAAALHHYEQMTHGFAERMIVVDRIETAVLAGRRDLAERWLREIAHFAEGTGSAWAAAVAEHGMATLAEGKDVGVHLTRALELHAHSPRRVDAARTHLAYGEWLRRERRRVDARPHLRTALKTFEDVGARRWVERAAQELRASGERAQRRKTEDATAPRLTPTELQVAGLVAHGLPTREVAAQLFVSPRTVDFHLRNVFAKLGVTSRAELANVRLK
ncbi:LuxR family transcriptional regulator [Georgenia sp. SYP-B2076]|uniref:helix-turn-helix transcriptional regulator n=1 Tax=Georgenia sp. SYP-B2076 TaxID=2495881 RepID=UPI000F8E8709|nr:LuxR family transcriptional regulator [Georgenia sp. SYP-B2076]